MTTGKPSLAQLLGRSINSVSTTSEAEAGAQAQSTPFFDRVIAIADDQQTLEELLTKITGPIDPTTIPRFPSAECLTVEQLNVIDRLGPKQQVHIRTCPYCKNMVRQGFKPALINR